MSVKEQERRENEGNWDPPDMWDVKIEVANMVETIQGLHEKYKYFHLQPCACDAPMWQQPCLFCSYYPDWGASGKANQKDRDSRKGRVDKESFAKRVNQHGSILLFYISSFATCIDPQKEITDFTLEATKDFVWPTPEEIWDWTYQQAEARKKAVNEKP